MEKKFSAPSQIKIGTVMLILNAASRLEQPEFPVAQQSGALLVCRVGQFLPTGVADSSLRRAHRTSL